MLVQQECLRVLSHVCHILINIILESLHDIHDLEVPLLLSIDVWLDVKQSLGKLDPHTWHLVITGFHEGFIKVVNEVLVGQLPRTLLAEVDEGLPQVESTGICELVIDLGCQSGSSLRVVLVEQYCGQQFGDGLSQVVVPRLDQAEEIVNNIVMDLRDVEQMDSLGKVVEKESLLSP